MSCAPVYSAYDCNHSIIKFNCHRIPVMMAGGRPLTLTLVIFCTKKIKKKAGCQVNHNILKTFYFPDYHYHKRYFKSKLVSLAK